MPIVGRDLASPGNRISLPLGTPADPHPAHECQRPALRASKHWNE